MTQTQVTGTRLRLFFGGLDTNLNTGDLRIDSDEHNSVCLGLSHFVDSPCIDHEYFEHTHFPDSWNMRRISLNSPQSVMDYNQGPHLE